MSKKQRFLIFVEAVSMAHVTRSWSLAQRLVELGHEVHFACPIQWVGVLNAEAIAQRLEIKWHQLNSMTPGEFERAIEWGLPFADEPKISLYVEEEKKLIEEVEPDWVVGDFRMSLNFSSKEMQVPYITLVNAYWTPEEQSEINHVPCSGYERYLGVRLNRMIFQLIGKGKMQGMMEPYNSVARRRGMRPFTSLQDLYSSGDVRWYADVASLFPAASQKPQSFFVGPLSWASELSDPPWWSDFLDSQGKPKVLISLGSTGDHRLLQRWIQHTLPSLPFQFAVTTSQRSSLLGRKSQNVFVTDFLNFERASQFIDVAVTNGGSASSYQILRSGVPVLAVCRNLDQMFFSERLQAFGAGLAIRSPDGKTHTFVKSLESLLEGQFKSRARSLVPKIAFYQSYDMVGDLSSLNSSPAKSA